LFFASLSLSNASALADESCTQRGDAAHLSAQADNEKIRHGSGELHDGVVWAKVQSRVPRSMESILDDLARHQKTKGARVDEMEIKDVNDPLYLLDQKVHYVVRPFLFVNVDWEEEWTFDLLKGTSQDPRSVRVSYKKTAGTSHIEHLCGQYVLNSAGPGRTDVTIYEEVKATRRSEEDALNGIRGTLMQLKTQG
jgi:hypothetical protein